MYGILPGSVVANKALLAYKAELAPSCPIVIGAAAGIYGAVLQQGQIMTQQSDGTYLPAASGDAVTIGQTKVLAHTVTLDGSPTTNVAGYYGGYLNKAALVGTAAQIAALGVEHDPGVIVMKQW